MHWKTFLFDTPLDLEDEWILGLNSLEIFICVFNTIEQKIYTLF